MKRRCTQPSRNNGGRACRAQAMPGTAACWGHTPQARKMIVYLSPALHTRLQALVATGLFGETVDEALLQVARDRVVELSGPLLTPRRR